MPSPHRILFVDDDPNLLAAFQRNLRRQFALETAPGGLEALAVLQKDADFAVLVVDMRMPGMDGIEFIEQARRHAPHAVRIMLTGNVDQQTAADAVNRGEVFRFLNKPCPPEVMGPALEHALKHYDQQRIERELLEGTLTGSVRVMAEVLGMVAPDALGRGQRLCQSIRRFARLTAAEPGWEFEVAALLSPIGYASLPARLVQKISSGAELVPAEEAILRRTPQIGHDLLVGIPRLEGVARIVLYQAKHFDGQGFPADTCAGERLPLGARMLKVLSDRLALEAEGIVKQRALDAMRARAGLYDPRVLESCFTCFPDFLDHAISSTVPVRALYLKELVEGQVVVSDITTPEGLVLVGAGNRLTAMILERLGNYDQMGEVKQPVLVQDAPPQEVDVGVVPTA